MIAALPIALAAAAYAWGVHRLRRPWPVARSVAAAAGLVALFVALGPMDAAADRRLTAHMWQHVLIGAVAPGLLAASAPVRLALGGLGRSGRRALAGLLHGRAMRVLARPAVLVPVACAVLLAGHLPSVMDAIERHPMLHALDHAALFWTSLAAWVAVLGVDPIPSAPGPVGMLAALGAWMTAMATVGSQYASSDRVLVGAYAGGAHPLAEQHAAGVIMWLGGMITVAPVAVVGSLYAMWREEQRQRRRDEAEAAG